MSDKTLSLPAPSALSLFIRKIEPWYNWGVVSVERLQELRLGDGGRIESGGEGPVRFFEIQWLGIHLQVQIGRTPRAIREGC